MEGSRRAQFLVVHPPAAVQDAKHNDFAIRYDVDDRHAAPKRKHAQPGADRGAWSAPVRKRGEPQADVLHLRGIA